MLGILHRRIEETIRGSALYEASGSGLTSAIDFEMRNLKEARADASFTVADVALHLTHLTNPLGGRRCSSPFAASRGDAYIGFRSFSRAREHPLLEKPDNNTSLRA